MIVKIGDSIIVRQPRGQERRGVVVRIDLPLDGIVLNDSRALRAVDTGQFPDCLIDYRPETGPVFWCRGSQVAAVAGQVAGE